MLLLTGLLVRLVQLGTDDDLDDLVADGLPALALVPDVQTAAEALAAGARGVLVTTDPNDTRVSAALEAVAEGLVVLDGDHAEALLRGPRVVGESDLSEPLTGRETETLDLLAEGLSNREIGELLEISASTAKFHVRSILAKLGAQTRTEAVVLAARSGLLEL